MSTQDTFATAFGTKRGRVEQCEHPWGAEAAWLTRFFLHLDAASDEQIRELAHLASTIDAEEFDWAAEHAIAMAWTRAPKETTAMCEGFDYDLSGRLEALDDGGICGMQMQSIAFCLMARDDLWNRHIQAVRVVLAHTDASIDEKLGQPPLSEW